MIKRVLLASLMLLFSAAPAFALSDGEKAELKRITDYWNKIVTVSGRFTQTDSRGGSSAGDFLIRKPGRFRFDYAPPQALTVIADGYTVAVEDKKLETQDRYPLVETPLSVLVEENVTLEREDMQILSVQASEASVTVHIKSLKEEAQGEILIAFNRADLTLQNWVVRDPEGLDVTVRVSDVTLNAAISPDKFFIRERETEEDER